jgi:hypothetical protein
LWIEERAAARLNGQLLGDMHQPSRRIREVNPDLHGSGFL